MRVKSFLLAAFSIVLLTQGYADNAETSIAFFQPRAAIASTEAPPVMAAESSSQRSAESTSSDSQAVSKSKRNDYKSLLEVKAGYFFFANSKMRKVFNHGGIDAQLSGVTPVWRWLHLYGSVEYLQKSGRSLHGHQRTRIWEVPLSLGLQGVARIGSITQYYLTIGPRYVFAHVSNKSHFVDKTLNANGIAGFVNTGFRFFTAPHFFWDIFGEYSYCRLNFHPHKKNVYKGERQVGGFVFGGGIGYAF